MLNYETVKYFDGTPHEEARCVADALAPSQSAEPELDPHLGQVRCGTRRLPGGGAAHAVLAVGTQFWAESDFLDRFLDIAADGGQRGGPRTDRRRILGGVGADAGLRALHAWGFWVVCTQVRTGPARRARRLRRDE